MPYYQEKPEGLSVTVRVQPRASRNLLELTPAGELRVRTTAPPVDSAANQAVVALLADVVGVSRSRVKLVSGEKSRQKVLLIEGAASQILERIEQHLRG